jgi:hypothetical protein
MDPIRTTPAIELRGAREALMDGRTLRMAATSAAMVIVVAIGSTAAGTAPAAQDSAILVSRLQQEVAMLRNQLDYEKQQLERSLSLMETRLRRLENEATSVGARGPVVAVPDLPAVVAGGREIRTQRLVVEDASGRARAVLTHSDRFGALLSLLDSHGEISAMLSSGDEGPRLEIFDARRVVRASLGLDAESSRLLMAGPDGAVRARLEVTGGEASLDLEEAGGG